MIKIYLADGIPTGKLKCSVVLQPADDDDPHAEYDSHMLDWAPDAQPRVRPLAFSACAGAGVDGGVCVIGRLGEVARVEDTDVFREDVEGPELHGNLTSLRRIERRLYACGVARQVYVRETDGTWSRCDAGALDEHALVGEVSGFRDIDGCSENDIYAVGLDGAIWNRVAGHWRSIASPTNVILEQVRVTGAGVAYAVGQRGVVLKGSGDHWQVLEQTETTKDFWGLEWFKDQLYACTAEQVYRIHPGGAFELLDLPGEPAQQLSRLRAGFGTLWLFSATRFFWSDGGVWNEAQLKPAGSTGSA